MSTVVSINQNTANHNGFRVFEAGNSEAKLATAQPSVLEQDLGQRLNRLQTVCYLMDITLPPTFKDKCKLPKTISHSAPATLTSLEADSRAAYKLELLAKEFIPEFDVSLKTLNVSLSAFSDSESKIKENEKQLDTLHKNYAKKKNEGKRSELYAGLVAAAENLDDAKRDRENHSVNCKAQILRTIESLDRSFQSIEAKAANFKPDPEALTQELSRLQKAGEEKAKILDSIMQNQAAEQRTKLIRRQFVLHVATEGMLLLEPLGIHISSGQLKVLLQPILQIPVVDFETAIKKFDIQEQAAFICIRNQRLSEIRRIPKINLFSMTKGLLKLGLIRPLKPENNTYNQEVFRELAKEAKALATGKNPGSARVSTKVSHAAINLAIVCGILADHLPKIVSLTKGKEGRWAEFKLRMFGPRDMKIPAGAVSNDLELFTALSRTVEQPRNSRFATSRNQINHKHLK